MVPFFSFVLQLRFAKKNDDEMFFEKLYAWEMMNAWEKMYAIKFSTFLTDRTGGCFKMAPSGSMSRTHKESTLKMLVK